MKENKEKKRSMTIRELQRSSKSFLCWLGQKDFLCMIQFFLHSSGWRGNTREKEVSSLKSNMVTKREHPLWMSLNAQMNWEKSPSGKKSSSKKLLVDITESMSKKFSFNSQIEYLMENCMVFHNEKWVINTSVSHFFWLQAESHILLWSPPTCQASFQFHVEQLANFPNFFGM